MICLHQRINIVWPLAVASTHVASANAEQAFVVLPIERMKMNTYVFNGQVSHRQTISARVQEGDSAPLPRPVSTGFFSYNQ